METKMMFEESTGELIFEFIYDAQKSMMNGKDLGEAIIGMTTCIAMVGRGAQLDFESVYVFPIEEGSLKAKFTYTKRELRELHIQTVSSALGGIIGGTFMLTLQLIGQYGLAAFKSPAAEILMNADVKAIELCTTAEFRRSVAKLAKPINEFNQKVTLKVNDKSYEINCENQYKFITEDEDPILPELRNGDTVRLVGTLTRMNMRNNDLGFEYKGKTLSISPIEPDKNVATEYHQFTPLPEVVVFGVVVRDSDFVVPRLKVISMSEPETQPSLFKEHTKTATSEVVSVTEK